MNEAREPKSPRENHVAKKESPKKLFNDPVHGSMEFHPAIVAIIDTPQFQRLRDIKQLGGVYFVYPGASHNRFEHSLGVCHLAGQLLDELRTKDPELFTDDDCCQEKITKTDKLMVQIAGLCHDMGHGPFSHVFERQFMQAAKGEPIKHEDLSKRMFDHMMKNNEHVRRKLQQYGIDAEQLEIIKALIHAQTAEEKELLSGQKQFLFEIVANKRNGVDVDRWDYVKRDALYLGMQTAFDHNRMMKFCRVIDVEVEEDGKKKVQKQICPRDKEAFNMYEMFITRQTLHRKAYQHKIVKPVETMIANGLLAAEKTFRVPGKNGKEYSLSECITDMEAFTRLTDSVFYQIVASTDPGLSAARAWLTAIQRRKMHRLIAMTGPINPNSLQEESKSLENKIVGYIEGSEDRQKLEEADGFKVDHPRCPEFRFIVQMVKLDYGTRGVDPLKNIRFYRKGKETEAVSLSQISTVFASGMEEMYIHFLLRPSEDKDRDTDSCSLLHGAIDKWRTEIEQTNKIEISVQYYDWLYDAYS